MNPNPTLATERRQLPHHPDPWGAVAAELQAFAQRAEVTPRDLWVILPFAQHLPLAREAWSRQVGVGWMPRFETTDTLTAALQPREPSAAQAPTGDPVVDRLTATLLLSRQSWAQSVRRQDPAVFQHWVRLLVETTHQLMDAASGQAPARREHWWAEVQARLGARAGALVAAGEVEGALSHVACAWAQVQQAASTDALFAARPAAWAVVQAGGADPVMVAVVAQSKRPALWLDLDPVLALPLAPSGALPSLTVCQDAEDEAQVAAARVIRHVADGEVPVALVAQDRGLVRRIRALLDRERVRVHDETGWKLSTTRAGACVMGLLRLGGARAATEDLLDWLKGGFVDVPQAAQALPLFEATLRRAQVAWVGEGWAPPPSWPAPVGALWAFWRDTSQPLSRLSRGSLAQWQQALRESLQRCGAWARLQQDPAGLQLLQALRLDGPGALGPYAEQSSAVDFDRADHLAWVDEVLESSSFRPAAMEPVEVVIAPLSRCMLRPFSAVVLPGCDHSHLRAPARVGGCLSEAERRDLGLPTRDQAWQQERLALAHVLTHPRLSLSWRRSHQGQPLQMSALLEPLQLALRRAGRSWTPAIQARWPDMVDHLPVGPTAPSAPDLLPERLSATGYEALRACPYRFFALRMLGLEEVETLDDEPDRRDQGTWLHAVLHAFHQDRTRGGRDVLGDVRRLLAIGRERREAQGLDKAAFLTEWLQFERLAPAYVKWLHEQEAEGWGFDRGEWSVAVPGPGAVELRGVLDRVDRGEHGAAAGQVRLIDYKTSSADSLKSRVRLGHGLEDTQLAFYAALWEGSPESARAGGERLQAGYLALEVPVQWVEHKAVSDSAAALRKGLAEDLRRLGEGAGLPPLGEGPACAHCAADGLCRKEHWAEPPKEGEV